MRSPTVRLGNRGPVIPRLIFGTEHIVHLDPSEGGRLLDEARRELGLFHWDTAPAYGSHPHVAEGMALANREEVLVTSKVPSPSRDGARQDLAGILRDLDTEYLDICFLHNVKAGEYDLHAPALNYLVEARDRGLVRHVGISSHVPSVLRRAVSEETIDIVCGTLNLDGSRIDGDETLEDMKCALGECHAAGKGIYVIKVLGVGDLVGDLTGAIGYAVKQRFVHACNIGMRDLDQARENLEIIIDSLGEDEDG